MSKRYYGSRRGTRSFAELIEHHFTCEFARQRRLDQVGRATLWSILTVQQRISSLLVDWHKTSSV
ncbi:hypothetical protein HLY00_5009 [Mycolicibacterium hippocampi]|uniref:Transposase n=1 Tax=Mycolicibacterium hippocampi TaxID=659824 RepID=A0A850PYE4_9MYCO|nr:hypothetical protein [Mycolicibacterium hippocampi]